MQAAEEVRLKRIKMFHETQSIASQLPINIEGVEIEEFLVRCTQCHSIVPHELVHGYATKPLSNTANFQAVFVCPHCRSIAESVQRIKRIGKNTVALDKLTTTGKWIHSEMSLKDDHWLVKLVKRVLGMK